MSAELIRVEPGGAAAWSDAVEHVTSALSPLGTAARIVTRIGACVVEIGRFRTAARLEADRLARAYTIADGVLRTRQATIVGLFVAEERRAHGTRIALSQLGDMTRAVREICVAPASSGEERLLALGMIPILSGRVVEIVRIGGKDLVRLSDSLLLNDTRSTIASWRQGKRR